VNPDDKLVAPEEVNGNSAVKTRSTRTIAFQEYALDLVSSSAILKVDMHVAFLGKFLQRTG
jgi:hypothetical protein